MKKMFSMALMLCIALGLNAQNYKKGNYAGTAGSPHEVVKSTHVTVSYGRPYKKNREIFGSLVPYDQVWRAGADEATEITFDKDGTFGGRKVTAGTYTLFAKPGKKDWTIILNSKTGEWGAYNYEKIKKQDIAKVAAPARPLDKVVEQFTISVKDNALTMEWDKTGVTVPMEF